MMTPSGTLFPKFALHPGARSAQLLALMIGLGLISIWALFGAIAYEAYSSEWSSALLYERNVATLIEHDIARTFEVYDLSIKAASLNGEDPAVTALPDPLRRKALFNASATASGLGSILILDKAGHVTNGSRNLAEIGMDLSDGDYFLAQRDRPGRSQPFISHVFNSRINGGPMIGLSRPMLGANGAFDGVVVGSITAEFFACLFRRVDLPPKSAIMMVHDDGMVLMREPVVGTLTWPLLSVNFAAMAKSGTSYVRRSAFDDIERVYSVRQIGRLPAYLVVGLSTEEIMSRWWWRATFIGLGFVVLSAIVLFLAFLLKRELRRRALDEHTLFELAITDGLTMLANRRRFDDTLDVEWRRAIRESTSIALLMIDCDFFKAFNDSYGHLEGDRALKIVAETLRRCVDRPGDMVARFGGEEFIVLLPRTDRSGAARIAAMMHDAIAIAALPHASSPFGRLTVSIGAAVRRPHAPEVPSELVKAADLALYNAKAEGRDHIVFDDTPVSSHADWYQIDETDAA